MRKLGANAIRVYHVDQGDHSGCMTAFANAGIYLFVDLDTFSSQIEQLSPSWTTAQEDAFRAVMDEFHQFDNTAGFFIGNEVLTLGNHSYVAPYIKAATRDLKAYRNKKGYRNIPIGYSHGEFVAFCRPDEHVLIVLLADITDLRPNLQNYLVCGSDTSDSIDFFGLNAYEWCGANTYQGSGYANLTSQVTEYPIPIFISETGCATMPPRDFQDQAAIFSSQMTPYWSGAIIYEWLQEANHYGLISYEGDTNALITRATGTFATAGTPKPVTPDFSNLMSAWAEVTPVGTSLEAYTPSNSPPPCPPYTEGAWEVAGNVALPSVNEAFNPTVQYSITAGHLPTGRLTTESVAVGSIYTPTSSKGNDDNAAGKFVTVPVIFADDAIIGNGAILITGMLGLIWWL